MILTLCWKLKTAAAAAKSLQLCPTLCDPTDSSPLGYSVPGILQARTLEWVAISFSNAWKWKVKVKSLSHARLLAHGLQPTRLLRSWDFPGKSTGVGYHCLLCKLLKNTNARAPAPEILICLVESQAFVVLKVPPVILMYSWSWESLNDTRLHINLL